jgi:hypothetical protein
MLAAAAVPAAAAKSAVQTMTVVFAQPKRPVASAQPAAMKLLAMAAAAVLEMLVPTASQMPAAAEYPAGDLPRSVPAPCRLAGGPCNR